MNRLNAARQHHGVDTDLSDVTRYYRSSLRPLRFQERYLSDVILAPIQMVEAVAALCFSAGLDLRLTALMEFNSDGLLNAAERDELESLAELSERLSLVRAEALQVLTRDKHV